MQTPFGLRHWSFLRPSSFVIRHSALSFLAALLISPALGQRSVDQRPPPLDPTQAKAEAKALVAELLVQKPDQNSTNTGQVRIRDRDGKETEKPARFLVVCAPTNWMSIYEVLNSSGGPVLERLEVVHTGAQPNQYRLSQRSGSGATNLIVTQL